MAVTAVDRRTRRSLASSTRPYQELAHTSQLIMVKKPQHRSGLVRRDHRQHLHSRSDYRIAASPGGGRRSRTHAPALIGEKCMRCSVKGAICARSVRWRKTIQSASAGLLTDASRWQDGTPRELELRHLSRSTNAKGVRGPGHFISRSDVTEKRQDAAFAHSIGQAFRAWGNWPPAWPTKSGIR